MRQFLAAALFACVLIAGGCSGEDDNGVDEVLALADTTTALMVEGFEYQQLPDGSRVMSGLFVNASSRHVRNAQIQVSLYDDLNQAVGSVSIPVSDIEAETEKAFRYSVDRNDVAGARVRSILVGR